MIKGFWAGEHWNPEQKNQHGFPWSSESHLGDLPPIYVDSNGEYTTPVLAPKIKKLKDTENRSLVINRKKSPKL